jgi:N-acyl amino acid synthase of PEP-CTERM/exosortase system
MDGKDCLQLINQNRLYSDKIREGTTSRNNITSRFHRYFQVIPAYVKVLVRQAKRLRYQVYCLENPNIECYQNMMEEDEYDYHSVHSLIRSRKTGVFAGTVRLILPSPTNPHKSFPIEKQNPGVKQVFERLQIQRENIAELNRLAVSAAFKRRRGEAGTFSGVSPLISLNKYYNDERFIFPHITMGLFASAFIMSAEYGITHWYAATETPLLKLLNMLGMQFTEIGTIPNQRGKQTLVIGDVNSMLLSVREKRPDVWEFIIEIARVWRSSTRLSNNMNC